MIIGYAQIQEGNDEDAQLISPIAIWIYQLFELIKTSPHDINSKNRVTEKIEYTLDNFKKARSTQEFYTDYCKHQKPAVSYCRDCAAFLDVPCVKFHKEIKFLIPHDVFNFNNGKVDNKHILHFAPKSSCQIQGHVQSDLLQNKSELLFYCRDCRKLLCQIGRQQHKDHIIIALNKRNEIEIMFTDMIQSCGHNPQSQLKQIKELTVSIITRLFGENLVPLVEALASIASSEFITNISEGNTHISDTNNAGARGIYSSPQTDMHIGNPSSNMDTSYSCTRESADTRQPEQDEILQTTGNGFPIHACIIFLSACY